MLEGQEMLGGIVSEFATVTLNEQLDVSPTVSVAVHVTVVAPKLKVDPEAGEHATVGVKPELSVAVGFVYVTVDDVPVVMILATSLQTPITGAAVKKSENQERRRATLDVFLNKKIRDKHPHHVNPITC